MRRRSELSAPAGRIEQIWIDSKAVAGNLLGDPARRRVDVYIPAGHDGSGLPLLVDVVGFTAGGPAHTNWKNHGETLPERADRLIASGAMKPVMIAFPDCFTRLGGNQYVNSPVMGRWEDFLIEEMLPAVEGKYGCGGAGKRGIFGKSSGGYGAIYHALKHGGTVWNAASCHSGDMGFGLLYSPGDWGGVLRTLAKHQFDIAKFIESFESAVKSDDKSWHAIMFLAQAASFDPDPASPLGVRLPVTTDTCQIIAERWANWLAFDPLSIVEDSDAQENLKAMKTLYIDCGDIDQYNLVYGARLLTRRLTDLCIDHRYEEFPDTHSGVDYRMDISLPILAAALS